jgi:acyl-CoA thioester hydrolase
MFTYLLRPGFSDTDALGHISNTRLPVWFEHAREPIFKIFMPDLNVSQWQLILANINIDFKKQLFLNADIEIKTYVSKIGNSSFTISQQAWQNQQCAVQGTATMVHFDYKTKQSMVLPLDKRSQLEAHQLSTD